MTIIEPYDFQKTTAFKERLELGNKINEIIENMNIGSLISNIGFVEKTYQEFKESIYDTNKIDKMFYIYERTNKIGFYLMPGIEIKDIKFSVMTNVDTINNQLTFRNLTYHVYDGKLYVKNERVDFTNQGLSNVSITDTEILTATTYFYTINNGDNES